MTSTAKSLIMLAFTLVVGFSLGLFADATLVRGRRDRINRMGRPPGMVDHLTHVIQPRDSAQATALRPIIQHTIDANEQIIKQTNEKLRANMDSLRVTLGPSLDDAQRSRLEDELKRMPRMGGPGGGGRGRGGPRGRRGGFDGPSGGAPPGPGSGSPPP